MPQPKLPPSAAYVRREQQRKLLQAPDRRLRLVTRLRRVLGWVCAAAFVLFFAANASLFTRETLRSFGIFATDGLRSADAGNSITFDTSGTALVAAFGDGLAVCDHDALILQKPGSTLLTEPLGYGAPALETTERYALAYDRGGYGAVLTSSIAVGSRQTLDSPILFGCVGQTGDYALITSEAGYRAAVTVYSSGGKQRFKWATPDYSFGTAALSPDGKRLAISAFRQNGTTLESTLFLRDLDSESSKSEVSLGSVLPIAARFLDENTLCVVGDYQSFIISRKGKIIHDIHYAAGDLTAYAFGDGSAVLAVRSYASTSRTGLITIGANGRESSPLPINEDILGIAYDGARLGLLTASGLSVYDSALRPLWENANAAGARAISLMPDGTVWVVYPKQAERISSSSDTAEVRK